MSGYDIIGDIHGCAAELKALLGELGYVLDEAGVHRHPERIAVFVGDLVDRGPGQLEVLRTVKAMVDCGSAHAVMGNHEFNAICFATPDPNHPGEYLRRHGATNVRGHKAFTGQLSAAEQEYYLEWFTTLPLWLDLGGIRVIHACWHPESMRVVEELCGSAYLTTRQHYVDASTKGHPLYEAVEILLKGPEISLADLGQNPYVDHGGTTRTKARVRWWDPDARTLRDIADVRGMKTEDGQDYPPLPDDSVNESFLSFVYRESVPVIYGHYWFEWDNHREDWTRQTACVDFSAVKDDGRLVAYRWDGGPITWENYVPHTADVVAQTPSD